MHSRIYKIQPDFAKPFEKIEEDTFYDNGFLDGNHDYVSDDTDWVEDYQWLSGSSFGNAFVVSIDGEMENPLGESPEKVPVYYLEVDLEEAFKLLKEKQEELIKQVSGDTIDAFSYNARELIVGDTSGFYFYCEGEYMTNVDFLLYLITVHGKSGTAKFRLEGSLDYHS